MPYTQATILEIHRLGCVVPFPIPRLIQYETEYRGYRVPKVLLMPQPSYNLPSTNELNFMNFQGTCVISNHWAVHMDKDYWGDPETFRPERFINEKGEFVANKHVVHFGFGK